MVHFELYFGKLNDSDIFPSDFVHLLNAFFLVCSQKQNLYICSTEG